MPKTWTSAEDAEILRRWPRGDSRRTVSDALPGRSWGAIRRRASLLGFGSGGHQGYVSALDGETLYGFHRSTLVRIWALAGVETKTRRPDARSKRRASGVMYEESGAEAAVHEYLAGGLRSSMNAAEAAAQLECPARVALAAARYCGLDPGRCPYTLTLDQWRAALERYRAEIGRDAPESLRDAAARLGVTRARLRGAQRRAGLGNSEVERRDRSEWDRIADAAASHRARIRVP